MTWYPYDNRPLVPGMFLKVVVDGEIEIWIVGDVNANGGMCDCCSIDRDGISIIEYSISKLQYLTELKTT